MKWAKRAKIKGKLSDHGTECMFIGYATNTTNDVYRFLNMTTLRVIQSRDVTWLSRAYGENVTNKNEEDDAHNLHESENYEEIPELNENKANNDENEEIEIVFEEENRDNEEENVIVEDVPLFEENEPE